MPWYEYICVMCGHPIEMLRPEADRHKYPRCPECDAMCDLVVSLPAKRRDMTVIENP